MSTFAVTVEQIKEILPHGNADLLELGTLTTMAFQFVVKKGSLRSGDRVAYFPIDSLIPEDLQEVLGVKGYLAGSEKNRVKTVKLRGMISQGVVCPLAGILDFIKSKGSDLDFSKAEVGLDLTAFLGVEKYDPPGVEAEGCILHPLPGQVSMYDIEGADRHLDVVEILLDLPVEITEKLEGTNFWAHLDASGEFCVGQRRGRIESTPGGLHAFQKYADEHEIKKLMEQILFYKYAGASHITLRGEFLGPGVQGNYYDLKSKQVRFFDLEINGVPFSKQVFHCLIPESMRVPEISFGPTLREWLGGKTIQEASNGMSLLNSKKRREGIVICPMGDIKQHPKIGRLFIKQRSPEYLSKTDF